MQTKTCKTCGTCKDVDQFHVNKGTKDGLCSLCKTCKGEYVKQYQQDNKVKLANYRKLYRQSNKVIIAEKKKDYFQSNKVAFAERAKTYQQTNKVEIAAYKKSYTQANPEKGRAHKANRRARKLGNGGSHTAADIKELFVLQKGKCACCNVSLKDSFHIDHIYALVNGGGNDKYNLQLLCQPCNNSKHAKDPITFMQQRGFLL
jgi:5-methylcytosine-specific restriction endonuclease McrA